MHYIANKKAATIAFLCIIALSLVLLIIYRERLLMPFRESTSLEFHRNDMEFIRIRSSGSFIDIDNTVLNCVDKIETIISHLNSLELVEAELPRRFRNRLPEDVGSILIHIGEGPNHNPGDVVVFWANYMMFSYHGHKTSATYYVRNSGFCNRIKSGSIHYFLREVVSECPCQV